MTDYGEDVSSYITARGTTELPPVSAANILFNENLQLKQRIADALGTLRPLAKRGSGHTTLARRLTKILEGKADDRRILDCRCACGHEMKVTHIGKPAPLFVQCPVCLWYGKVQPIQVLEGKANG